MRRITTAGMTATALLALALGACGGGGGGGASSTYSIGGTVSGLGAGQAVTLQNKATDGVAVSANGGFTFASPVARGSSYAVTATPSAGMACTVGNGTGTAIANVTNVTVACTTLPTYTVGGTVSGLVGQGLQLELGGNTLDISANGRYVFPTPVLQSFAGHAVTVSLQPQSPAQHCIVQNPYFFRDGGDGAPITNVNIACGEFAYVTDAAAATVTAYSIDASSGALAALGTPVATGAGPVAVAGARDKQYLYVSDSGDDTISGYAVDAGTGALTPVPGSPLATGKGPGVITVKSETWCTQPGRGGNRCTVRPFVFVALTGADSVASYEIDQATGALPATAYFPAMFNASPVAMTTGDDSLLFYVADASSAISDFESAGGGMSALAPPYDSHGKITSLATGIGQSFLYAANASGAAASILRYIIEPFGNGPATTPGKLSSRPQYPLANCRYLVSDRNGNYIYATTDTSLYGYAVDPVSGALKLLHGFPVATGIAGDAISIDPSNQFLYVVDSSAGKVAGFRLDVATGGVVAPIAGSPFALGGASIAFATL